MNKFFVKTLLLIILVSSTAASECDKSVLNCDKCQTDNPLNCAKCSSGFYADAAHQCQNCLEHCDFCVTPTDCITCAPNFQRKSSTDKVTCESSSCEVNLCSECQQDDAKKCKTCKPEAYLEAKDSQCYACDSNCKTCETSKEHCLTCGQNFKINENTHVCEPQSCKVDKCTQCIDGDENKCQQCQGGFFPNSQNQCSPCLDHCALCDVSFRCITCEENYQKIGGLKDECIVKNCLVENCQDCLKTDTNVCERCKVGAFLEGSKCSLCSTNCTTCETSKDHCTSCPEYFRVNPDTHVCEKEICTVGNCTKCVAGDTNNCLDCNGGFYKNSENHCNKCLAHCELCETSSSCFRCEEHYEVKGTLINKCVVKPNECQAHNCAKCTEDDADKCETCASKTYLTSESTCKHCDSNCLECQGDAVNCTSCPAHYDLNKETHKCVESACMIDNCGHCKDGTNKECDKCISGFYLENSSSCKQCDQNCLECTENPKKCTECHPNYKVNDETKQCVVSNCQVENCATCNDTNATDCIKCNGEFFKNPSNSSKCYSCTPGCQDCENADICKACKAGFALGANQKCDSCPPNCKSCSASNNCTTCEVTHGVNKTSGFCELCPSNCTSCNYAATCDLCEKDLVFDENQVKCTVPHNSKAWLWILITFGLIGLLVLIYLKVVRPRMRKVRPSGTSYGLLEEGNRHGGHSLSLVAS